jgi:HlyD family secretion protein
MRPLVLGLLGLGLAAAMVFVVMRSGPLAPTRVTVVQAAEGRLTPALFGIGTVEARRSYLIGPTVAGRVRAVAVDVGDRVKAGQLLASIEVPELKEDTERATAAVKRSQAAHAEAKQTLGRIAGVAKEQPGLVAQQDIDTAQAKERTADAQADVAEADLHKLESKAAFTTTPMSGSDKSAEEDTPSKKPSSG